MTLAWLFKQSIRLPAGGGLQPSGRVRDAGRATEMDLSWEE